MVSKRLEGWRGQPRALVGPVLVWLGTRVLGFLVGFET